MQNLGKGFLSLRTTTGVFEIHACHRVRSALAYPYKGGRLTAIDIAKNKPRVYVPEDCSKEMASMLNAHLYHYGPTTFLRREPLVIDKVACIDLRENARFFVFFKDFDDILPFDTEDPHEMLDRAQKFVETGIFD